MKLEEQVCSLESARRLKELGVKQESLFYWIYRWNAAQPHLKAWFLVPIEILDNWVEKGNYKIKVKNTIEKIYSAFTVAELGELLPAMLETGARLDAILTWSKLWHGERIYFCERGELMFEADTEAEARAKMLIYLLENDLIKLNGG